MEITYFIGNGFDLAMGLHTSYRHFVKHYLETPPNEACDQFLKKLIAEDVENWSDAEAALGQCTESFNAGQEELFCECYTDFVLSLSEFLESADRSCISPINIKDIRHHYTNAFTNLEHFIPHVQPGLKRALSESVRQPRNFSIINFNYTHVFDHGIDVLGRKGVAINSKTPPNCDTIGEVHHIHGEFSHEMVMGVDGDDQIANQDFARNAGIRQRIIKPEVNEALNHGLVMDCKKTISKSQIIVVFGMSIGKTDRTWWKSVGEWLKRSKDHQLIIFIHIEGQDTRLAGSINVTERGTQNRLLNFTALTDVEKENVRHQITVVLNCELFGTRLFRLK